MANETLVIKTISKDDCTLGFLWYKDFNCLTLELPWLDNKTSISCILEGSYRARKRVSKRNGKVIELIGVPNRTYIQIHKGNFTSDIEGCILVGDTLKDINQDGTPDVGNSGKTMAKLYDIVPEEFWVQIFRMY